MLWSYYLYLADRTTTISHRLDNLQWLPNDLTESLALWSCGTSVSSLFSQNTVSPTLLRRYRFTVCVVVHQCFIMVTPLGVLHMLANVKGESPCSFDVFDVRPVWESGSKGGRERARRGEGLFNLPERIKD